MRRILLVAAFCFVNCGCGTLTVVRHHGIDETGSRVRVHYRHHRGWAREIVNSYRFNPWPQEIEHPVGWTEFPLHGSQADVRTMGGVQVEQWQNTGVQGHGNVRGYDHVRSTPWAATQVLEAGEALGSGGDVFGTSDPVQGNSGVVPGFADVPLLTPPSP